MVGGEVGMCGFVVMVLVELFVVVVVGVVYGL